MKSALKGLLTQIQSLTDGVTAAHPDATTVTFNAYTSVPSNAGKNYIYIYLDSSEDISPKDRYLEQGIINIDIVDMTKEDSGSNVLLLNAKEAVEAALAPSLFFTRTSITNGTAIDFRKLGDSYAEEYVEGLGKVKTQQIQVFYLLEWTGAVS